MKRKERADLILKILNKLYPTTPIPLNHKNIYELLISVLLSAQCTDKRVNEVTPILFKKANNPFKMKDLSVNQIYKIIRPCGLAPKKSRAIKGLSLILSEKFDGAVPENFEELLIFTDWLKDGVLQMEKMFLKLKKILKNYLIKSIGINYIYK